MSSIEEQLIDLQMQVAFQDDTIRALSDALGSQQIEIERLTRIVKIINGQVKQIAPEQTGDPSDEPPPPHY